MYKLEGNVTEMKYKKEYNNPVVILLLASFSRRDRFTGKYLQVPFDWLHFLLINEKINHLILL